MLLLTETEISLPHGPFLNERKIPFDEIENLTFYKYQNELFVELIHRGKKIGISRSFLPEGAFERVCDVIDERTKGKFRSR